MSTQRERCERCGKVYRGRGAWNARYVAGVEKGLICPACQTPDENVEAEINEATLNYGVDAFGRSIGVPK